MFSRASAQNQYNENYEITQPSNYKLIQNCCIWISRKLDRQQSIIKLYVYFKAIRGV